ncbi:M56 family metallopeptidase [Sphingomonas koreensis]
MLQMLIALGWKSAVIAMLALLADRAMRGRPAAERVFVLRLAVIALLLLPAAAMLLPAMELALLPAPDAVSGTVRAPVAAAPAIAAAPSAPEASIDLPGLLYALGAAAVMLHLAIGVAVLTRWTRRGVEVGEPRWRAALSRATAKLRRPVRLLVSDDVASPISWGIAPAWILIDAATLARAGQADAVVAHEMAHIRRFDWPMLVAARIAVALLWFNPLVWLLNRTLARRGETAADEAAVRGIERADYAEALLSFATAPAARGVATGMALWPNALAERITHIATHRHRRGSRMIPVVALSCAVIVAPPLALAKLVPASRDGGVRAGQLTQPVAATVQTPALALRTVAAAGPGQARAADLAGAAVEPGSIRDAATQGGLPTESRPIAPPVPAPGPVVQVVSAPQPIAQPMRIVGQTGAEVVRTADGVTITAPPPRPRVEETPEWARQAAADLTRAAADLRNGARNIELTAELPGVSAAERAKIAEEVSEMREEASDFEARARALRGPGG